MRRTTLLPAICLLWSAGATPSGPARIEMDVLDKHEVPSQAVRRMEDAHQASKVRKRGVAEQPGVGPYDPEALGDRGLMTPVALEAPGTSSDPDRHDGLGNDRDRHDKDQGGGHDADRDADKDHDKGDDKGDDKDDKDKGDDKGHGKDKGGPGG